MPVLTFDNTAKRFILPSTQQKPGEDQGWVEMTTYPLCADDYGVYYGKLYALDPDDKPPLLNVEILARRIKHWNYTDAEGKPLPITAENIGHLQLSDLGFLINRIDDEPTEVLDESLKGNSSATSSTSPTETPQV